MEEKKKKKKVKNYRYLCLSKFLLAAAVEICTAPFLLKICFSEAVYSFSAFSYVPQGKLFI